MSEKNSAPGKEFLKTAAVLAGFIILASIGIEIADGLDG
jgi:hypothetical protein